jgi:PAS domain S-box-containing protein
MSEPELIPDWAQRLVLAAPVGLAVLDATGSLLWSNLSFQEFAGPHGERLGDRGGAPRDPDPSRFWSTFDRAVHEGRPGRVRDVRLEPTESGRTSFVDVTIHPAAGGGPRAVAVLSDVTDRVAEQSRARLFYESFLTSSNPMEVTDRQGVLVDVNPAFERIYRYSRSECVGRRPNIVSSPRTDREVYNRMWADLLDPTRGHWSGELVNRDREGKEHPVFLTITAIRNDEGETTHYLGVAVDRTEQRAWERQAAHSERLVSLGQLAAGVAHEINTPLANVMLVTESIRRRTLDPWVQSRLDTIAQQVEVTATIVRGLLDFARRSEPQITTLDLGAVVRDAVQFLRGKQSANVDLVERYPEGEVPVSGDRGQIIQVLTNILNNAYEAMEGSGRIVVTLRRNVSTAEIEITDAGPGIPPHLLPHIFEPFFTTKPEGKGTGLGLAICHGIMQAHHGSVSARNVPEGGASFLLTFPLAAPTRISS